MAKGNRVQPNIIARGDVGLGLARARAQIAQLPSAECRGSTHAFSAAANSRVYILRSAAGAQLIERYLLHTRNSLLCATSYGGVMANTFAAAVGKKKEAEARQKAKLSMRLCGTTGTGMHGPPACIHRAPKIRARFQVKSGMLEPRLRTDLKQCFPSLFSGGWLSAIPPMKKKLSHVRPPWPVTTRYYLEEGRVIW